MSVSEIRFSLPEGMTDSTVYLFASDHKDFLQQESLMVSHDRLPQGVQDLDGLVKYRLDELKAVAPGELKVTEDAPSRLGAIPARRLDILASAEGASIRTLDLLALLKDGTYMQLAYKVRPRDPDAVARIDYMAASLSRPGQATAPAAAGFTRRQAGTISLEIPSDLRPPSDYLFLFPEGQGRLEMRIWRVGEPNPPGTVSSLMERDAAMAAHVDSTPVEGVTTEAAKGQIARYTTTEKQFGQDLVTAVWRARMQFRRGTVAAITARAKPPFQSQAGGQVDAFINSLREE